MTQQIHFVHLSTEKILFRSSFLPVSTNMTHCVHKFMCDSHHISPLFLKPWTFQNIEVLASIVQKVESSIQGTVSSTYTSSRGIMICPPISIDITMVCNSVSQDSYISERVKEQLNLEIKDAVNVSIFEFVSEKTK